MHVKGQPFNCIKPVLDNKFQIDVIQSNVLTNSPPSDFSLNFELAQFFLYAFCKRFLFIENLGSYDSPIMVHVWVLLLKCHHFRFSWQPRSWHKWLEPLDNSLRIIRRPSCELALFKCSLLPSVLASGWSRYAAIKHIVRQHKYMQSSWKIRTRKKY